MAVYLVLGCGNEHNSPGRGVDGGSDLGGHQGPGLRGPGGGRVAGRAGSGGRLSSSGSSSRAAWRAGAEGDQPAGVGQLDKDKQQGGAGDESGHEGEHGNRLPYC